MKIVDLVVLLILFFIGYYAIGKIIPHFRSPKEKASGDLGALEKEAEEAAEARRVAEEAAKTAKDKVDQTLHKVEEIKKKL